MFHVGDNIIQKQLQKKQQPQNNTTKTNKQKRQHLSYAPGRKVSFKRSNRLFLRCDVSLGKFVFNSSYVLTQLIDNCQYPVHLSLLAA